MKLARFTSVKPTATLLSELLSISIFLNPSKYPTAVGSHVRDCEACFNSFECGELSYQNFQIMNRCRSKLECDVREAFLIRQLKPSMNSQLFEDGACVTLKVFG